jgi:hypothetical protein
LIFAELTPQRFPRLKPLIEKTHARGMRNPRIVCVGRTIYDKLPRNTLYMTHGHFPTMRARALAAFLAKSDTGRITVFFDEDEHAIRHIHPLLRIRPEIKHLNPKIEMRFVFKTARKKKGVSALIGRFEKSVASAGGRSYLEGLLDKYERVPIDTFIKEIILAKDFPETWTRPPAHETWIFPDDTQAVRAIEWCNARAIGIPDNIAIVGYENDPAYYHYGITSCIIDWDTIGYLLAHAAIGDISIARTSKRYIQTNASIIQRRTTIPQ